METHISPFSTIIHHYSSLFTIIKAYSPLLPIPTYHHRTPLATAPLRPRALAKTVESCASGAHRARGNLTRSNLFIYIYIYVYVYYICIYVCMLCYVMVCMYVCMNACMHACMFIGYSIGTIWLKTDRTSNIPGYDIHLMYLYNTIDSDYLLPNHIYWYDIPSGYWT